MGYEIAHSVSEIDDEFLCSICTMILENSMESPCEHTFCNDCIKEWLKVKASCPVDNCLLSLDDLKPTPRYFRNLLNKVEVKCNFEPKGCQAIVPLHQLQHHLTMCVFNPNTVVVCDKGCNQKMTRGEYVAANCFIHLANRQQEEFDKVTCRQEEVITKLTDEVGRQREEISKWADEVSQLRHEITKLSDEVSGQRKETTKPNDDLSLVNCEDTRSSNVIERQRELTEVIGLQRKEIGQQREDLKKLTDNDSIQRKNISKLADELRRSANQLERQQELITNLCDEVVLQREEITKLNDVTTILYKSIPAWRICENMKTLIGQPQILEHGESGYSALAQTFRSLEQSRPFFRIQVLTKFNYIVMGLTPVGKPYPTEPYPGFSDKSIGYESGHVHFNNAYQKIGEEWKNGDIIDCGIEFPDNFTNDGKSNVEVYFAINGTVTDKKVMRMPLDGLFPTVYMENGAGEAAKVKFLNFI